MSMSGGEYRNTIGFFLSFEEPALKGITLIRTQYDAFRASEKLGKNTLYLFAPPNSDCITQINGVTAFSIGTLVYKKCWGSRALHHIVEDLLSNKRIEGIMDKTGGQFCLIVHIKNKTTYIVTDKLGCFPVYIFNYNSGKEVQISNLFCDLAKRKKFTLNRQALMEYLSFDYCIDCTFFNEIALLKRGNIYSFAKHAQVTSYNDFISDITFRSYGSPLEIVDEVKNILKTNTSFLNSRDKIVVDITGGFDTRTLAVILDHQKLDFASSICGEQDFGESSLSEKVARALNVPFHSDILIDNEDVFHECLDFHFYISNGVPILYHSTELIHYYLELKKQYNIHLAGFAGTQLFTQFIPPLSLLLKKINYKAILQKYFNYIDIVKKKYYSKASYNMHIKQKINKIAEEIGSKNHNKISTVLSLFTYNKYYHGSLLGAHNTILPIYSPYLESNIARLMIETPNTLKNNRIIQKELITKLNEAVSKITTSHGYNAHLDSEKKKNIKVTQIASMKDFARRLFYDINTISNLATIVQYIRWKISKPLNLAEIQRPFWVNEIKRNISNDLYIFEIIDKTKLSRAIKNVQYSSKLKAKILYLDRLLRECNLSIT